MRKGMKVFGTFLVFCLMPILGIVANDVGVPTPPPPPPPVERFISEDLEKACSSWKYEERKEPTKGIVSGGMGSLFSSINQGKSLRKTQNTEKKKKSFGSALGEAVSGARIIALKFTSFLDEKADQEHIASILKAKADLEQGYEIKIDGEKVRICSITEYRLLQEILKNKIKEMEEANENLLKASKEMAEKLYKLVAQVINDNPDLTQWQIKEMKKNFCDAPNNEHRYPKAFYFFALVEEMKKKRIITQEQYDVFNEIKEFFEKERTFEKIQEVTRKGRFVEKLRKAMRFKPEILNIVSPQEAEIIMQMDESDIRKKVPEIISPEDKATIRTIEYKIYVWQYVKEKVDQILTNLSKKANVTKEQFRKYILETKEIQKYAKSVKDFCDRLRTGDDPEKHIEQLEEAVKTELDGGMLFPLVNPTEQDKLDLTKKPSDFLPSNVEMDSKYTSWSYEWIAQFFKKSLRDSKNDIVEAYEAYKREEKIHVADLKKAKKSFFLPNEARIIIANMRDLSDAIVMYGNTSVKWVSGLFFLMDHCEANIRALSDEKQKLFKKQKSAVSRLKSEIKTRKEQLKAQDVSLFEQQITGLLEQRKAEVECMHNIPEGESGVFKLVPDIDKFVPLAKKLEEAQSKIDKKQQTVDEAGATNQSDLLSRIDDLEKERDYWKNKAERLDRELTALKDQLKNRERELKRQKTEFEEALNAQLDALRKGNQSLQNQNQSLQRAKQSLSNENTDLKNRKPIIRGGGTSTIYRENKEALNKALDESKEKDEALRAKDAELANKDEQIQSLMNENSSLRQKLKEAEDNDKKKRHNGNSFLSEEELLAIEAQAKQLNQLKEEIAEENRMLNQKAYKLKEREEKVKVEEKALRLEKNKNIRKGEGLKAGAVKIGNDRKKEASVPVNDKASSLVPTTVKQPDQQLLLQQPIEGKHIAPVPNRTDNNSQIQTQISSLRNR